MKLSLAFLLTLLSFSVLQSFAQADSVNFLKKEKGFITKDGCKVLVKQYYGLSENRYYFALKSEKNYFFLDTNEVASFQNIKIGKNKELGSAKYPGLKPRLWAASLLVTGPIIVILSSGYSLYYLDEFINLKLKYNGGGLFLTFISGYSYVFYKVIQPAIFKVRLVKAFKTGKPYMC